MSLRIVHTFGKNAGEVQLLDKEVVRFGRAPDNDIVFDPNYDRDASSHHAEIRKQNGAWVLVDQSSKNGTWVAGQRVTSVPITSGIEIMFGAKGPRVRVELVGAAPHLRPAAGQAAARPPHEPTKPSAAPAMTPPPPQPHAPQAHAPQAYPPQPHAPRAYAPQAAQPAYPPAPQQQHASARPPAPHAQHAPQYAQPPRQPSAPAVNEAPPAGKRVGQRTMAWMINAAVSAARGRGHSPNSTRELSAYVEGQVDRATAGQRRATYVLGAMLIVALAGLGALVVWSSRSEDEIATLREQLASLPPDDPRRKDIEGRLGTLHPSNASFGRNLYDRSKKGIFMLTAGGEGFCTAFAVRPNILATNAHCVAAAKRASGSIRALENEGKGQVSFAVTDMKAHPGYRDQDASTITPDVGIVTMDGRAAVVLELATAADLQTTGAGDDVYLIGFPGRLMDSKNPAATFLAAHVGRVTNPQGRLGAYADNWLVQHDAATTHGTSGSPVFNGRGKVIAINAGGYTEGDDETIAGRKTEVVKASPYKFGMRIDLLDAILK